MNISNLPYYLSLLIGLGVIVESLRSIPKFDFSTLKIVAILLLISLIAFAPGKKEYSYDLFSHFYMFFGFYAFLFAISFKDKILPVVNELGLLLYTSLFWIVTLSSNLAYIKVTAFLGILPTLLIIYSLFTMNKLSNLMKFILYVWYTFVALILLISQFSPGNFSIYFDKAHITAISPIGAFLFGMTGFHLIAYILYLWELVPIPGKRQSFKNRMKQLKEDIHLRIRKFSDHQLPPMYGIVFIVTVYLVFMTNLIYKLVPDYLLLSALILLNPEFLLKKS